MITINIDLESAVEVKALVLFDHNITNAATITLIGVDPALFSEAVTWADDKILHYLSVATTKRYWQLQITDASNPDGYIEIGELFLGSYVEFSRTYDPNVKVSSKIFLDVDTTAYGVRKTRFRNYQQSFGLNFPDMLAADNALLEAMLDNIGSRNTGIFKTFFFNRDSDYPNTSWMVELESIPQTWPSNNYYSFNLPLIEVVKSL